MPKRIHRIAIVGKTETGRSQLRRAARQMGFRIVAPCQKPGAVLVTGGDGTLLRAERLYPGIPKVPIRESSLCVLCNNKPATHALHALRKGNWSVQEILKLEAVHKGKRLFGASDIVVRNKNPAHAIRFVLHVNKKRVGDVLIGDGIVVATPLGSTGYYRSVARKTFAKGVGLAFNNLTRALKHRVLPANTPVTLRMVRGQAHLVADNNPRVLLVQENDSVTIRTAMEKTRIIRLN